MMEAKSAEWLRLQWKIVAGSLQTVPLELTQTAYQGRSVLLSLKRGYQTFVVFERGNQSVPQIQLTELVLQVT